MQMLWGARYKAVYAVCVVKSRKEMGCVPHTDLRPAHPCKTSDFWHMMMGWMDRSRYRVTPQQSYHARSHALLLLLATTTLAVWNASVYFEKERPLHPCSWVLLCPVGTSTCPPEKGPTGSMRFHEGTISQKLSGWSSEQQSEAPH